MSERVMILDQAMDLYNVEHGSLRVCPCTILVHVIDFHPGVFLGIVLEAACWQDHLLTTGRFPCIPHAFGFIEFWTLMFQNFNTVVQTFRRPAVLSLWDTNWNCLCDDVFLLGTWFRII
uniref:Uncharacterized protein n=1 Tax=Cacopsylla melanoneura TaxID=428564 RepID=A0A8D8TQM4_9HEMI